MILCLSMLVSTAVGDDELDSRTTVSNQARLDEVLDAWEAAFAGAQVVRSHFLRYEFDEVFLMETRSEGELLVEGPDRMVLRCRPVDIDDTAESMRTSPTGQPYRLQTASPSDWYMDQSRTLSIDHEGRSYAEIRSPAPASLKTDALIDPLMDRSPENRYLRRHELDEITAPRFGFSPTWADDIRRLYMALGGSDVGWLRDQFAWSIERETDEDVFLVAKPDHCRWNRNFRRIEVRLSATSFRPSAVRMIDPSGSKATVYVMTETLINDPQVVVEPPDLTGYRTLGQ